jgi:hypothetical protein
VEFVEYYFWRAVVLVVLAFIYGFWRGTQRRR